MVRAASTLGALSGSSSSNPERRSAYSLALKKTPASPTASASQRTGRRLRTSHCTSAAQRRGSSAAGQGRGLGGVTGPEAIAGSVAELGPGGIRSRAPAETAPAFTRRILLETRRAARLCDVHYVRRARLVSLRPTPHRGV